MEILVIHNGDDITQRDTIVSLLYLKSYLLTLSVQKRIGVAFSLDRLEGGYSQFNLDGKEVAIVTKVPLTSVKNDIKEKVEIHKPEILLCSKEMFQYLSSNNSNSSTKYADYTIKVTDAGTECDVAFASEFIKTIFNYLSKSQGIAIPKEVEQSDFKSYL